MILIGVRIPFEYMRALTSGFFTPMAEIACPALPVPQADPIDEKMREKAAPRKPSNGAQTGHISKTPAGMRIRGGGGGGGKTIADSIVLFVRRIP